MNIFILLAVAVLVVAVVLMRKREDADIDIPSAPQRSDLLMGYYGCSGPQVSETREHVGLHWECFWDGQGQAVENIKSAQLPTVLDVDTYILTGDHRQGRVLRQDAEGQLRMLFGALRLAGVLHLVRYIVPTDEPNLPENNSIAVMPEACALIRRVAQDYPELSGLKLGVIYYYDRPMDHIELFDVVGFNHYKKKSAILAPGGMYEQMRAKLRPDQKTWLLLGATYGQAPEPFLNYANANSEVLALVCFLWRNPHTSNAFTGIVEMPKERARYEALGAQLKAL